MARLWIRRFAGLSMVALAVLGLIFTLHTGSCADHDHEGEGKEGGAPTHLVCHCACHVVTIPDDLTPSIPTTTLSRPFAGPPEQDVLVGVVPEIDPPTDKRSA